jgi:hypothetical protein
VSKKESRRIVVVVVVVVVEWQRYVVFCDLFWIKNEKVTNSK